MEHNKNYRRILNDGKNKLKASFASTRLVLTVLLLSNIVIGILYICNFNLFPDFVLLETTLNALFILLALITAMMEYNFLNTNFPSHSSYFIYKKYKKIKSVINH